MMTTFLLWALVLLLLIASVGGAKAPTLPRLRVSDNHRYLITDEPVPRPFFWLGDTAWMIRKLTPAEIDLYLSTREKQGFTVIQIAPASSGGATDNLDYAGRLPFIDNDAEKPVAVFWENIDTIVDKAQTHSLYVLIFPIWGQDLNSVVGGDPEKAQRFGRWLGQRYKDRTNVMWAVTGEYDSVNNFSLPISESQKQLVNALARGIYEGHGGTQLMSIHPGAARTSSLDFHNESWLSFNMLQSGHQDDSEAFGLQENHALIAHDYGLRPTKPVFDGEPMYEDTPNAVWIKQNADGPRAGAEVMRRKAYWAVFAGAFGHTYGYNDLWFFYVPTAGQTAPLPAYRAHWKEALHAPGAEQMQYLRKLMESRPFLTCIPDQSLIVGDPGTGLRHIQAIRGDNGGFAMLYIPIANQTVTVDTKTFSTTVLEAYWYDPRTGKAKLVRGYFRTGGTLEFTTPKKGPDWVLVLEEPKRYQVPGDPTIW